MNKQLVKSMQEALIYEENAAAIYSKHLASILQWTGLPKEKLLEYETAITKILNETRHHKQMIKKILEIENGD